VTEKPSFVAAPADRAAPRDVVFARLAAGAATAPAASHDLAALLSVYHRPAPAGNGDDLADQLFAA
jgi:hypothetical protein